MSLSNTTIVELTCTTGNAVESFYTLGMKYLHEMGKTKDHLEVLEKYKHIWSKECKDPDEYFLKSIIRKIGEKDRWLHLLKSDEKVIGFVHSKVDKEADMGYVMEFYIEGEERGYGYGKRLYQYIEDIFVDYQLNKIWLETHLESSFEYWKHLGFIEVENDHPEVSKMEKLI